MLFTKLAVRLGESGERFSSFCQSSISYFPAFVKRLLQFLSDFFARPVLFFAKKSRQKKLRLSGTIYRFFRLPCVKGAPPKAVRDCFYNPSTTSWSPSPYTGEANSEPLSATPASVLRTLANPSLTREGLLKSIAAPPHRFSSIFSLISSLRAAVCSAAKMREKIL